MEDKPPPYRKGDMRALINRTEVVLQVAVDHSEKWVTLNGVEDGVIASLKPDSDLRMHVVCNIPLVAIHCVPDTPEAEE